MTRGYSNVSWKDLVEKLKVYNIPDCYHFKPDLKQVKVEGELGEEEIGIYRWRTGRQ